MGYGLICVCLVPEDICSSVIYCEYYTILHGILNIMWHCMNILLYIYMEYHWIRCIVLWDYVVIMCHVCNAIIYGMLASYCYIDVDTYWVRVDRTLFDSMWFYGTPSDTTRSCEMLLDTTEYRRNTTEYYRWCWVSLLSVWWDALNEVVIAYVVYMMYIVYIMCHCQLVLE